MLSFYDIDAVGIEDGVAASLPDKVGGHVPSSKECPVETMRLVVIVFVIYLLSKYSLPTTACPSATSLPPRVIACVHVSVFFLYRRIPELEIDGTNQLARTA